MLRDYQHLLCQIQRSMFSWWHLPWWEVSGQWGTLSGCQSGKEVKPQKSVRGGSSFWRHPDLIEDFRRGRQKARPPLSVAGQSSAHLLLEVSSSEDQRCTVVELWLKCSGGHFFCRTSWYHTKQVEKPWFWSWLGSVTQSEKSHGLCLKSEQLKGVGCTPGCRTKAVSPKGDLKGFD